MVLRAISPSDISPNNISPGDIRPVDIGSGGIGAGDIFQPTQLLDALILVVRDLGDQLAKTYLPPEAHLTVWQRLQDLYLEVFAISTAFTAWTRQ